MHVPQRITTVNFVSLREVAWQMADLDCEPPAVRYIATSSPMRMLASRT